MNQSFYPFLGGAFLMLFLTACNQPPTVDHAVNAQDLKATSVQKSESGAGLQQFVARGNEPFWTIKTNGSTLTWITPDNIQGTQLKADAVVSAEGVKYSGVDGNTNFTLFVTHVPCVDTMSEETFEFTSVWTYGKERNSGCAASGR